MKIAQRSKLRKALGVSRGAFTSTGLFSFVINLLMLTGPMFMLQVYDRVMTSGSIPTLVALVVLIIVLFSFMGALELIRKRIMGRIGVRFDEQLGNETFDAVQLHAIKRTPNVGGQPVRDLDIIRQFISGPGPLAFFDTPWMPIYRCNFYVACQFTAKCSSSKKSASCC